MKLVAIGKSLAAIALGAALAACSSGNSVEVGEKQGAGAASSGGADVWTGYLEGVVLMGESTMTGSSVTTDELTLSFETRSASGVTGTVVFGSGSPPQYEPTVAPAGIGYELTQGVPFPMREGTLSGTRVKFVISPWDKYEPWCAAQTTYQCNDASDPTVQYYQCQPCGPCIHGEDPICSFCGPVGTLCQCTATGCSASAPVDPNRISFDLTFQGDVANGTVLGVNGSNMAASIIPVNVRLTRAQ